MAFGEVCLQTLLAKCDIDGDSAVPFLGLI